MIVETDASDYAITAIFSIILPNCEIHPVTFHSFTLTTSELKYNSHDKKPLAIFLKALCYEPSEIDGARV